MNSDNELDYEKLKVDKEDCNVRYSDELHKYWTKDTKQSCISVTTLIHQFGTFDPIFWSAYKTLEALITPKEFLTIKTKLLDTKIFNKGYYEQFNISEELFESKKSEITAEWDRKRDESCIRGTAIHKQMEDGHLSGETKELQKLGLGGIFTTDTSNNLKPNTKGVYPELLLSRISEDKKLRLAGQADLIVVDGLDVWILDYKTNKSIDTKSFFDRKKKSSQKLKYPLNHLDDCNFMHYTMQLSTYAWMIQKINPAFNIKGLILLHYDHDNNYTEYECEYLKDDVERMLQFYRKQVENEQRKERNKKMIF